MSAAKYSAIVKIKNRFFPPSFLKYQYVYNQNGCNSLLSYLNKEGNVLIMFIYDRASKKHVGTWTKAKGWNWF